MPARRNYERWYRLTGDIQSALRLGDVSRQLEDFKSALYWYRVAKRIARSKQLISEFTDAKLGEAMCARGLEEFSDAIRLLKECSKSYFRTRDVEGFAYVLWALGTTQRFAGVFTSAEKNLRLSIKLYQHMGDPSGLAYARCGLGGTLRMLGRHRESFSLYRKANIFFRRVKDRFGEAYSNCGQGNALRMLEKVKSALSFMEKAESIYRQLGQKGPLGFVLWSRAQADIYLGDLSAAKKRIEKSRQIFKSVRDPRGLVYCDLGDGQWRVAAGDHRSMIFFRRALKASIRQKLPFEALHARRRLRLKKSPCKIIQIP